MKIKIPRPEPINPQTIIDAVIARPSAHTLSKIHKTKKFVTELMSGSSLKVAKKKAGFSPTTSDRQILASPVARLVVKELVDKNFHNKRYLKKLKEFWDAKDRRATKDGDIYETPNWATQMGAFDRVTKIRELVSTDDEDRQPHGITIQIVGEGNVQLNENVP